MNYDHKRKEIRKFLVSLGFGLIPNQYPEQRYDGWVCMVYCPVRERIVEVGIARPSLLDAYTVNFDNDEIPTWPDWCLCDPAGLVPLGSV